MDFQSVSCFPRLNSERLELWIWYAEKIPPHIGCSVAGKYFSLKSNGRDHELPVAKVARIVSEKKIPFLLISVNIFFDLEDISDMYRKYECATELGPTCLSPILDLLEVPDHIRKLKDLIGYLEGTDGIKHIFGYNLPVGFTGIADYSEHEIRERLRKLENAKRKESIPSIR